MERLYSKINGWGLFGLLLVLSFFALQQLANYSLLRINLSSSQSAYLKIYWTTHTDPSWSESKSSLISVLGRKKHHIIPLRVPTAQIKQIRIDPSMRRGIKTVVRELNFHHLSSPTVSFKGAKELSKFTPNDQIKDLALTTQLSFKSLGRDPWLIADFPSLPTHPEPMLRLVQSFFFAVIIFGLLKAMPWLFRDLRWVAGGMVVALIGVALMALLSAENAHPDEGTHVVNAQYYTDHYIPPVACSEASRNTYSTYGVSRLDNREIAYYVGGRYLQMVDFVPASAYSKLRYLNVALFLLLTFIALLKIKARILFLPLMLTPQVWYLFSYYNSDALSLFTVMIAAYQVFVSDSFVRQTLRGERPSNSVVWIGLIALLIAMQFWLKLNYVFYPIFLLMLGGAWCLLNRRLPVLQHAKPLFIAAVLGLSLFATWEISRHAVNDFTLQEKALDCREVTAGKLYKPSTPLADTHPNYNLRGKGISMIEMITERNWSERIFYTGIGAYGYLEFLNSYPHYAALSILIVLLFLYATLTIAIKGGAMAGLSVLAMLASMAGITFAAVLNNWDQDYQPQGRYLLVYFPLFGSLLAMYARKLNLTLVSFLAWLSFLLAAYSFFGIGLVEIPKAF